MAKKKKTNQKVQPKPTKDSYAIFKDPSESIIGKIVISILIFGMIAGILIGATMAVIQFFQ